MSEEQWAVGSGQWAVSQKAANNDLIKHEWQHAPLIHLIPSDVRIIELLVLTFASLRLCAFAGESSSCG